MQLLQGGIVPAQTNIAMQTTSYTTQQPDIESIINQKLSEGLQAIMANIGQQQQQQQQ